MKRQYIKPTVVVVESESIMFGAVSGHNLGDGEGQFPVVIVEDDTEGDEIDNAKRYTFYDWTAWEDFNN